MKTLIYSARAFEIPYLKNANNNKHKLIFHKKSLSEDTVQDAKDFDAISIYSADKADFSILKQLQQFGVGHIALRSAGYDNVALSSAKKLAIKVANVPAYSPFAVAEHSVCLLLALNRKLLKAQARIKRYNFKLDSLTGFDLNKKTVGIIGTGAIGSVMVKIMHGFGCNLLGYDIVEDQTLCDTYNLKYLSLSELCEQSDIITLHVPLTAETHHLIDSNLIKQMKPGVFIINTARGAVLNTEAIIKGLEENSIGGLGMDVYEHERGLFFKDHSQNIPEDMLFKKLNELPNVIITGHQAFLTKEALMNIADTTIYNLTCWSKGQSTENELTTEI
ncbi:MAG: 2-hydroxyacid dehydrogenase [Flavobacteriaceae bacterium]|nr:2-hydroxyacid dehydrogenase [Flavobacteriaceae bacterium]